MLILSRQCHSNSSTNRLNGEVVASIGDAGANMQKLIECVPNFSEGRDQNVIRQIAAAIESVHGVSLLDVDTGAKR
jgi:hypothetical protein